MTDAIGALFERPGVRTVFDAVQQDEDEAWLVGGCVRNALLGEPVGDIDIATQAVPEAVIARAQTAGIKAVPTGIDHGTVTLVVGSVPFEITTLRKDVATDGRRAVVAFSRHLGDDAVRRDFTMNALYVSADGTLHDPVGGLDDLEARRLRFIGNPVQRITEDYLRILRFFRFYGWYGRGAPDRDAIKAIVNKRDGLRELSAERVWSELKKLLSAPDAGRALLWMRQCGVYQIILPESGDMDGFARLQRLESALEAPVEPLRRLLVLLNPFGPDRTNALAERLRLSGVERKTLLNVRSAIEDANIDRLSEPAKLRLSLYQHGASAIIDAAILRGAASLDADPEQPLPAALVAVLSDVLKQSRTWKKPSLPVSGSDLVARGIEQGPQLGAALSMMEGAWVASDFQMGRDELLDVLKS
ncbi:MAG: CCA tRNA nucleotidyltransferase [Pseudomonadota bacterium]